MEAQMIRALTARILGVEEHLVKDASNLTEELGADSLDLLKIAAELEEAFQLQIDRGALMAVSTVGDLRDLLG